MIRISQSFFKRKPPWMRKNNNSTKPTKLTFNPKHGHNPDFINSKFDKTDLKKSWRYHDDKDADNSVRERYKNDKERMLKAYMEGTFQVRDRFKIRREKVQYYTHQNLDDESREHNLDAQLTATSSPLSKKLSSVSEKLIDQHLVKKEDKPKEVVTKKAYEEKLKKAIEEYQFQYKKFYNKMPPNI